ncbi:hypothetical protein SAY86_004103 [Trapa natans]|uniref:PPM-type phosphatase domain-containing protein n=1 Tax=Trapa natans TaxID=22666 RepID=A0AAN7RNG0_TRANT|nr:hypothetical protein SAY86_004103 [Trapa natans]
MPFEKMMSVFVSARGSPSSSLMPASSPCSEASVPWSGLCLGPTAIGEEFDQGGLPSYHQEIIPTGSPVRIKPSSVKVNGRPTRLVLPEQQRSSAVEFSEFMSRAKAGKKGVFEVRGRGYFLASKNGRRAVGEDGYGVVLDISGDPKQAFFTVIDGHGGHAATDHVAERLGENIVRAIGSFGKEGSDTYSLEHAIREGYLVTDEEFLRKGEIGGACAASVLLKDGELHAANVGDCRVVLSRGGVATSLTSDHRPSRDDERLRIERSGGFVHLRNGVWRVQGSLAISRAIGDAHLKEWIISEPEIRKLPINPDCQFLILGTDGLWDKVSCQEAVDAVSQDESFEDSCRKLIEMSACRGSLDDITVMVIDLRDFVKGSGS